MATQAQITAVQQLYVSYLGRAADKAGLDFWSNAIANGTSTIESVATGLTLATEYQTAYGNLSTDALVDAVYTNVLGRTADAAGKAFWVSAFANGTVKADTFVSSLIQSLGAQDQATINNKTFVAQTYTDTVGDAYTPAGGAAVLVGVDSTAASVNAALAAIANGNLPGQVPALGLITAVDTALAAQAAFETAGKADADALVAKIAAQNKAAGVDAADTETDNITATSTYADKIAAVNDDAALARLAVTNTAAVNGVLVGDKDTTVIESRAVTAQKAVDAAVAKLSVTEKAAVGELTTALTNEATAKAGVATATEIGAAQGGLAADATATAGFTAHNGGTAPTDLAEAAADLYSDYVNGTTAQRTAIDTEFKDSAFYATFKLAAAKDAAYVDAQAAVATATDKLDNSAEGNTYLNAYEVKFATDAAVTAAKAADADVAAAKALADAYAVKTDATDDAVAALAAFNGGADVTLHKLAVDAGTGAVTNPAPLSADKDVFYFGTTTKANTFGDDSVVKVAPVAASDFTLGTATGATHFGAGDSIVLGSGYTYNSGALSTGDNNKTEFFLVQKGSDTLVIIETAAYGSSSTTHTATGDATAVASPDAAVITLTGVAVTDLSVNNGVISHVA